MDFSELNSEEATSFFWCSVYYILLSLQGETKAYDDLAKPSFTRTISNPENVLRRKRQQKQDQIEKYKNRPESGT